MTKLIGEIIHWSFPATYGISFGDVRHALQASGFDADLARAMLPRHAFSRACRRLADAQLVRLVERKPEFVSFQFTKEVKLPGELEYRKDAVLVLDLETNRVTCRESAALAGEAERLLAEVQGRRTAADVNRLVKGLLESESECFSVKPRSGVYFVPAARAAAADRVLGLVKSLGGEAGVMVVPAGEERTEKTVRQAVRDGLEKVVAEYEAAIEKLGDDKGGRAIENAVKRVQEAKLRVECHKEMLDAEAEGLQRRLDALKGRLQKRVEVALAAAG